MTLALKLKNVINTFSKISGLNLNKKKSADMWVGSYQNKKDFSEEMSWIKNGKSIKILVENLSTNELENPTGKIENMKLSVQSWAKRNVSSSKKVTIAKKNCPISILNYIIQALSHPKDRQHYF